MLADTDYAGCPVTRRSTTGGIVFDNLNPLHAWSTTQTTPAMSSGEAELYGCVKGSAEGLGVVSAMKDLGEKRMLRVGSTLRLLLESCDVLGWGNLSTLTRSTCGCNTPGNKGDLASSRSMASSTAPT